MDGGKSYSLTFARVVLGVAALVHGISDTFGVWGGPRLGNTPSEIAAGSTSADWVFYTMSIGLMVIGLALLLGMITRLSAIALLVVVAWHAIANSRFSAYFAQSNGCELLLMVCALCVVVATHGPGAFKVQLGKGGK